MKKRLAGILSFALFGLTAALPAQTPPAAPVPTPPPGPLVAKRAPDYSTWTVTAAGIAAAPAPGADPKKSVPGKQVMQVTKTGDLRRVQVVNGNGTRSEVWCKGAVQVILRPEWKEPLISTGENRWDTARIDFGGGDFAGFDWLSARNFAGVRSVEGRDCLVFQGKVLPPSYDPNDRPINPDGTPGAAPDPETLKIAAAAYTDLETRLPVALKLGDDVRSYKFGPPPDAPLTLPPNVVSVLTETNAQLQKMLRPPARP